MLLKRIFIYSQYTHKETKKDVYLPVLIVVYRETDKKYKTIRCHDQWLYIQLLKVRLLAYNNISVKKNRGIKCIKALLDQGS